MRKILQTLAISSLLLAPASTASAQINFGIHIGEPPAPRAYRVARPPGPDYMWINGYWYPQGSGSRYTWHDGYWTRPPYADAYWVEPYYVGGRYYAGRWEDGRHNLNHNHKWDKSNQRDERRGPPPNGPPNGHSGGPPPNQGNNGNGNGNGNGR